jgi:hypothetical protein
MIYLSGGARTITSVRNASALVVTMPTDPPPTPGRDVSSNGILSGPQNEWGNYELFRRALKLFFPFCLRLVRPVILMAFTPR